LLPLVGLDAEKYLNRYPHELSGGEAQRIGILRAIACKPKIILMDEPFSALDPISRKQLQELVKDLQKTLKITTVFVTHDMSEGMAMA
ncbi:ATP-binding cassette domain-containing protein, partial [Streptococcus suis]